MHELTNFQNSAANGQSYCACVTSVVTPPTCCIDVGVRLLEMTSIHILLAVSLLFRLCLLLYGEWQDRNFAVKFTDVDYHVFSDAAKLVVEGLSPYQRPTYRYTPIISLLLTPNHYLFYSFGKLIFIACDVLTGWLIYKILALRGTPRTFEPSVMFVLASQSSDGYRLKSRKCRVHPFLPCALVSLPYS